MTNAVTETAEFMFWASMAVLELAGLGPQHDWASDTARDMRNKAQALLELDRVLAGRL